jgi:hypothetical protein
MKLAVALLRTGDEEIVRTTMYLPNFVPNLLGKLVSIPTVSFRNYIVITFKTARAFLKVLLESVVLNPTFKGKSRQLFSSFMIKKVRKCKHY